MIDVFDGFSKVRRSLLLDTLVLRGLGCVFGFMS